MADLNGVPRYSTFLRPFFKLALANIISNLMVPLAGLVDTAFLGHLADIRHLAGVALATVIFNVVYWSFGFLRMGTTGTTAQARGRADETEVWLIAWRNGLIAIALASLILLLHVPIRAVGFGLLGAAPGVEAAGMDYFNRQIWGAPAVLLNLVLLGWFLGQEKGRWVVLLSGVGNGANVLLNAWFIRGLGWASGGAGLATALSQYLMLIVGLGLMLRMGGWRQLRRVAPKIWDPSALGSLFRLNRDIMVRTFALLLSFSLFTSFSAGLGTQVLAANTLLLQVVTLSAYFIDGIAFATESFAGRLHTSGQLPQLRSLLILSGGVSVALGISFALGFGLMPITLFGLLTIHQPVIDQAATYVGWLLPILGLGAIAYLLDGYFLGLTAGPILRNATLLATGIGFLPLALAARLFASPHLLWLALASFMATRALTLMVAVPKTLRVPVNPSL